MALLPSVGAAASWYQVEIVLFEQPGATGSDNEALRELEVPEVVNARELKDSGAAGAFARLPESQLQLAGVVRALRGSGERRPILHLGWRQPVTGRSNAEPVRIHGGRAFTLPAPDPSPWRGESMDGDSVGAPITPEGGIDLAPTPSRDDTTASRPRTVEALDGTLLISRSRFLHVWTDLVLTAPAPAARGPRASSNDSGLVQFRMRGHRRMRSGEIHYLDHPAFGAVILVRPIEDPASAAAPASEAEAAAAD